MRNILPYVLATLDAEFPNSKLLKVCIEQETVFLLYGNGEELIVRAWSPTTSFRQEVRFDCFNQSVAGFQGNSLDDTALVVLSNGDVFSVILNDGVVIELGSLETQIYACSWSPDLELVALYLETGKFLLLSTDFEKYTKALTHLIAQNDVSSDKILEFVERHELHAEALKQLTEDSEARKPILESQAKKFMLASKYEQAGLNFEILGMVKEAVDAYVLAQDWKKALSLVPEESQCDIALQIAESCEASKNFDDAGHLFAYFLQKYTLAIECYCQGSQFDDATLVAYKHDLISD
ncbi:hypothetical protein FF38_00473, partial [Lucilia cuprina]